MIYKSIRNLNISFICYGANSMRTIDDAKYIKYAIDCGINFIDTAENHCNGKCEEIIGLALKYNRKNIIISTKVAPENLKYNNVIQSCENSLKRLKTDYIDIYHIHWPNNSIPIEETLSAFEDLIKLGKIKYIGLSNFTIKQIEEIYKIIGNKLLSIQEEYNTIERSVEYKQILNFCSKNDMILMAYSPLRYLRYTNYSSDFALAWLINKEPVIPIIKSHYKLHIEQNCNLNQTQIELILKNHIDDEPTKDIVFLNVNDIEYKYEKGIQFCPDVNSAALDMKKYGLLKPLKVLKEGNKYKIVDGFLRYLTWKMLYPGVDIPSLVLNKSLFPNDERR